MFDMKRNFVDAIMDEMTRLYAWKDLKVAYLELNYQVPYHNPNFALNVAYSFMMLKNVTRVDKTVEVSASYTIMQHVCC